MNAFNRGLLSLIALAWIALCAGAMYFVWDQSQSINHTGTNLRFAFDIMLASRAEQILATIILGALMLPGVLILALEATVRDRRRVAVREGARREAIREDVRREDAIREDARREAVREDARRDERYAQAREREWDLEEQLEDERRRSRGLDPVEPTSGRQRRRWGILPNRR